MPPQKTACTTGHGQLNRRAIDYRSFLRTADIVVNS